VESDVLGSGGYGVVRKAIDLQTNEVVAAKSIDAKRMKREAILKEVRLMGRLKHPGVVALRGYVEIGKEFYIFMELAANGELFSRVKETGCLDEWQARAYFYQLMSGVQYLHTSGVAHRDLKLENILLSAEDHCKICDFGLAYDATVDKRKILTEVCGSKSYVAPEVLNGCGYDGFIADIWSCGICLFAMLAGFFPLDEASPSDWRFERVKLAVENDLSVTPAVFGFYDRPCDFSNDAIALLDGMLSLDPTQRWSVEEVLGSAWVKAHVQPNYRGLHVDSDLHQKDVLSMLRQDDPARPLYRACELVRAPKASPPASAPQLLKQDVMFCAEFHH